MDALVNENPADKNISHPQNSSPSFNVLWSKTAVFVWNKFIIKILLTSNCCFYPYCISQKLSESVEKFAHIKKRENGPKPFLNVLLMDFDERTGGLLERNKWDVQQEEKLILACLITLL